MQKNNFRRDKIIDERLMNYIQFVNISDRNKEIVVAYVNGSTYTELAEKYGVATNRIAQIIRQYIFHARIYKIENEQKSDTN